MELFLFNLGWMIFNVFLALIPVLIAKQVFKKRFTFLKLIGTVAWFFFLPNTLYLLTDVVNFLYDVNYLSGAILLADILMYIILIPIGIVTYIWAVVPYEKMFAKQIPIFFLNIFVGFGIVLGRVQRANSWEVITDPQNVAIKSLEIIRSLDLLLLVVLFAVLSQVIYEKFKNLASRFKI